MGSLGTGEIMVIVLVALIVFGPQRLPEITRKAGELLAKARQMSRMVTDSIDAEYGDIAAPIKELKGEYDATIGEMKGVVPSMPDLSVDLPKIDLNLTDDRPVRKADTGTTDVPDPSSEEEAS